MKKKKDDNKKKENRSVKASPLNTFPSSLFALSIGSVIFQGANYCDARLRTMQLSDVYAVRIIIIIIMIIVI